MEGKIILFCVNFNSYKELDNYLESIEKACIFHGDNFKVDVLVADNTSINSKNIDTSSYKLINISIYPFHENLGYMGAIMRLIEAKGFNEVKEYDYAIISNVDLILSDSFFKILLDYNVEERIGWIAPQIYSLSEKRDRNPKMLNRPSTKKLELLIFMYKHPILHKIYSGLIYPLRNKKLESPTDNNIYAGHGSLMIFTKYFLNDHVSFKFPSFLFGEEIFFGELSRSSGLKVIYVPQIIVYDIDHASTSKLKRKDYYRMNFNSLVKIKTLFENE